MHVIEAVGQIYAVRFPFDHPEEHCFATIDAAPTDDAATLSIVDNGGPCACRTTARALHHVQAAKRVRFMHE